MARALPLITSAFEGVSRVPLLVFALEVWIANDAPTFNTAHLAGSVFLFRDAIGDHALVCADAGRAH